MTIHDAREVAEGSVLDADLLIIGGGPAGIVLARAFADGPERTVVLESGARGPDRSSQKLNLGEIQGTPNLPLTRSRFRIFGGSTTRWAGQCAKLDPIDFERREGMAESGWPIDAAALEPWYERAAALTALASTAFAIGDAEAPFPPVASEDIAIKLLQFTHPRDFAERYGQSLEQSRHVDVFLRATAIRVETTHDLCRATGATVATLTGRRFRCQASTTVLAAGGIENSRLLLASSARAPAGLGNTYDQVGRYFTDHPYLTTGWLEPQDPQFASGAHVIEDFAKVGTEQRTHVAFRLDDALLRREQLNGCGAYFIRQPEWRTHHDYHAPGGQALVHVADLVRRDVLPDADTARHARPLVRGWREASGTLGRAALDLVRPRPRLALRTIVEASPRADSRVTLLRESDALGMPRVCVDWRLDPGDRRGLDRLRRALDAAFARRGIGRLVEDPALADSGWPISMRGGKHHMGTTRMHLDPKRGVVGPDLEVHGIAGLYVVGSSVFPTGGWANPTLTILALTLRLAEHLKCRRTRMVPHLDASRMRRNMHVASANGGDDHDRR